MPRTVTCLHHLRRPVLGHAAAALSEAGLRVDELDLRRGAAIPRLDDVEAILSLGGEQSVRVIGSHPELAEEAAFLREAGVSERQARAADARHLKRQAETGRAIFGAFAAAVAAAPAHA